MHGFHVQPGAIELLTPAQARAADGHAIADGVSEAALMAHAGEGLAAIVHRLRPTGEVAVLCGPGANGGDGFVAASRLSAIGRAVRVWAPAPPRAGAAGAAAAEWRDAVHEDVMSAVRGVAVIIDALFGAGLSRPLASPWVEALDAMAAAREAGALVVSADIPSGLDGATGQPLGPVVRADHTVTFARAKPAHALEPGRTLCGEVHVVEIGLEDRHVRAARPEAFLNRPPLWFWPAAERTGHKYGRGHALVVAGGPLAAGAARLSARAALRAGAGLVTLACPPSAVFAHVGRPPDALMVRTYRGPDGLAEHLADPRFNAVAAGPALGVGQTTRALVATLLNARRAVVLDADALTSFAGDAAGLAKLIAAASPHPVVLTPHEGEFARLFGEVDRERGKLERARAAAAKSGAVIVLKGSDTVIAAPSGRAAVSVDGGPELATAGSGDVLTGIVAGMLAQGMDGFEAACAAVWLHARAGARVGRGLIADDLPDRLPDALRDGLAALAQVTSNQW